MFFHNLTKAKLALIGWLAFASAQFIQFELVDAHGPDPEFQEAADKFNGFSLSMPGVILGRLELVASLGVAGLWAEPMGDMRDNEEWMIGSLVGGLRNLGDNFEKETKELLRTKKRGENNEN